MGVRKSETGSRVEAPQKRPTLPLIIFLLLHFSTPDFWLLGCLAPWLRSSSLCEQETQRGIESRRAGD
jgi:hypothetical protein